MRRGIDCAALPAPGAMIFTEQRGIMMMSTGVKSIFENFARFVQFGIDLYRLGLVVQFRIGTLYFFEEVRPKIKIRRRDLIHVPIHARICPKGIFETTKRNGSNPVRKDALFRKITNLYRNSQTVQINAKLYNFLFLQQYLQMDAD